MVKRFATVLFGAAFAISTMSACSIASPQSSLPLGVSIDVFQARHDIPQRVLEISVLNGSTGPLTITGARFDSTQFATEAEWTTRDSMVTVRTGSRIDLRVALPEANCAEDNLSHFVELDFVLASGVHGEARVPAVDRVQRLPQLNLEDCLGETVARNATVTTADTVTPTIIDGRRAATLAITITPTASDGAVELHALRGTVLLNLVDAETGALLTELPINRTVTASSAQIKLTVALEPQRCDPHVVAEDKRGTYLPMRVTTADGTEGTIYLEASPALRASLYTFVATTCGFPDARSQ